jgi:hypothetical protein
MLKYLARKRFTWLDGVACAVAGNGWSEGFNSSTYLCLIILMFAGIYLESKLKDQ